MEWPTNRMPLTPFRSTVLHLLLITLTALSLSVRLAYAEEPFPPLRRVYVPVDRLRELEDQDTELQSVPLEKFEDLVRQAQQRGPFSQPAAQSCNYQATLEGDHLSGTAELVIRGRHEARSLLRWATGPWIISDARWESGEATLGYAGRGELGLAVPAGTSHTLRFRWTLAGRSVEGGRRFEFRVPPSLWAELALDLPRGLSPATQEGWLSGPTDAPRPELQRWLVQWSGSESIRLLIIGAGGPQPHPPVLTYERQMEVDIAEEATELLARFDVLAAHHAVRQIEFKCSPALKLFGWSGVKVHDWQESADRVTLDLAESLVGPAQITVRGLAPGAEGGQWKLPRLEIANGIWAGGTTHLRTAARLTLYDLKVTAGRVVSAPVAPSGRSESRELHVEHATKDAEVSARLAAESPQIFAKVHTVLDPGPRLEAIGDLSWNVESGEVTTLKLGIPPGWSVEAVDVRPAGLLSNWSTESDPMHGQVTTLRLNRAVASEMPLTAQLRLLGPTAMDPPSDTPFAIPRLRPLDVLSAEETLSIRAQPAWTIELVEAKDLCSIELLPGEAEGSDNVSRRTYRFDSPEAGGKLLLHRRTRPFASRFETAIALHEHWADISYTIDVDSAAGLPDWLDITFHPATGEVLNWNLPEGSGAGRIDDESTSPNDSAVWRVTLGQKTARRVRFNATWRGTVEGTFQVPLPTISPAEMLIGHVSVTHPTDLELDATASDLVPIQRASESRASSSSRAGSRQMVWRYGSALPRLAISARPNPQLVPAHSWIAHTRLKTVYDSNGGCIHAVRYDVHSRTDGELVIDLPPNATLRRAVCHGRPVRDVEGTRIRVAHTATIEPWQVEIEYATPLNQPRMWRRLHVVLPEVSLTSLRFSWEFQAASDLAFIPWSEDLLAVPPHSDNSWTTRLFGRLARDSNQGLFRFWKTEAWANWLGGRNGAVPDPTVGRLRSSLAAFQNEGLPRDRTWARLIARLDQVTDRRLVVDTMGLGIIDPAASAALSNDGSTEALFGLTRTADLNLLRTDVGLLVTSREEAAKLAANAEESGLRKLDSRGGLDRAMREAMLRGMDATGRFLIARRWRHFAGPAAPPAVTPVNAHVGPSWRFQSAGQPRSVSLILLQRRLIVQSTTALVCGALLLIVIRRTRATPGELAALSFFVLVAFVAAVTVPEALAPLAAALAWSLLAVLIVWARLAQHGSSRVDSSSVSSAKLPSTVSQVGVGAVMVLTACSVSVSLGAPQDKPAPKYSVILIPYDPSRPESRHEASQVLVPRSTYEQLVNLARASTAEPDGVLVQAASYSGRLAADRLELAIDLDLVGLSSAGPARCSLPLAGLLVQAAQLDGKDTLLEPGPDGLTVVVPESGRHRLHLNAVLPVDLAAQSGTLELTMVPAPECSVDMEFPPELRVVVEPAAASAEWIRKSESQRLRADLGAAGRLVARWQRGPETPGELRVDSASLFTWKPAAARLEVRATVYAGARAVRKLVFEPDDRLVLERIQAPAMSAYWLRPGEQRQLVLEFDRAIENQVPVKMSFLVPDCSHQRIAVPEVRVLGAKVGSRLVGVRGDPKQSLVVLEPKEGARVTSEDFRQLWGEPVLNANETQFVRLTSSSPLVQLERLIAQDRPVFRAQTDLRIGSTRVDLEAQITSESTSGKTLRGELLLPAGMQLGDVQVSPGLQWRALGNDRLAWFGVPMGDAPPSIQLQGWGPAPVESSRFPAVRPIGDCQLAGEITIWRGKDLRVSLLDSHGLRWIDWVPRSKAPAPSLVADSKHEIIAADFASTLKVERLSPSVTATVASRIMVDDDGADWISVIDYQVTDGSFDRLELAITDGAPTLQIAGEGVYRRDSRRDGTDQVWTLLLEEPHWGSYRLVLRSPIEFGAAGSLVVPTVRPLGVADTKTYLLLENATQDEIEVRGVENESSIARDAFIQWFTEPITREVLGAYELRAPIAKVHLQRIRPAQASPSHKTLLERHRCYLGANGVALGESLLLVRCRNGGDAKLAIPASATVLQMNVDGKLVRPNATPGGELVAYLEPDHRPHEIQLWWSYPVFDPSSPAGRDSAELPRFTADECPAVWILSVSQQLRFRASRLTATARSFVEATQASVVAEELESLVAARRGTESPDRSAAIRQMQQSLVWAADVARKAILLESDIGPSDWRQPRETRRAVQELDRLQQSNQNLLDRDGLNAIRNRAESQLPYASPPAGGLLVSISDGAAGSSRISASDFGSGLLTLRKPTHFVSETGEGLLFTIKRRGLGSLPLWEWGLAAIGTLLGSAVLLWWIQPRREGFFWPASIALLGLFWCWRLQPEPIGPLLLFVATMLAMFRLIRRRHDRPLGLEPIRPS